MQSCEAYLEQISRMIDGDLPEDACIKLRAHLEQCEYCRSVYAAFSAVSAQLAEPDAPSIDLSSTIMEQIRQQSQPKPAQRSHRRFSQVRAAALAAGLALVLFAASRLPLWHDTASDSDLAACKESIIDAGSDAAESKEKLSEARSASSSLDSFASDVAGAEAAFSPALRLQIQMTLSAFRSSNRWISAIMQLCPVCDVTDGAPSMQDSPNLQVSLESENAGNLYAILLWQTADSWTVSVQLNETFFTLHGTRAALQQAVPETFAWITAQIDT